MTSTLLIVQIILAIAITIAVLLQKSSSIGLGAYSGSNESVFGAKGPTGFLSKLTFALALLFVINTLALGYFYTSQNTSSVADSIVPKNNSAIPTPTTKSIPAPEKSAPSAPVTTTETQETTKSIPAAPTSSTTETIKKIIPAAPTSTK